MAKIVKLGPWGGAGGYPVDMGTATRLARIQIRHHSYIDALRFQYERDGVLEWSKQWGGNGGSLSEIVLEEGEYLTFLFGNNEIFNGGANVVRSLTLISNVRTYGPYGIQSGAFFFLPQAGNNMIVGFYGKAGAAIDSIGVYMQPKDCCSICDKPKPPEKETIKFGAWVIQSHAGEVQYHWINSKSNDYSSVDAPVDKSIPGDLVDVWDFQTNNRLMDITAKYESPSLKVGTKYQLVMIVLLKKDATGWRLPLNAILPDGDDTSLQIPADLPRDSWQPVVIGNFAVVKEGVIELKIHDYRSAQLKDDFLLRGFELRPM